MRVSRYLRLAALATLPCSVGCGSPPGVAVSPADSAGRLKELRALVQHHLDIAPGGGPIRGEGQWLFLRAEGTLLLVDRFWGAEAQRVSQISDPEARDPLPQVLDFRSQLAAHGIELLFVPIPAKLAIYPEKVLGGNQELPRLDIAVSRFLEVLRSEGVAVLDLAPAFLEAKRTATEPLYLATDSHWSPRGILVAAEAIASALAPGRERLGLPPAPARLAPLQTEVVQWEGDIAGPLKDLADSTESVTLVRAGTTGAARTPRASTDSALLLLGDSYLRIFEAESADLRSHLERKLGVEIDQIAVDAGGPTASRQSLARQPDRLAGKRIVIWLSAARLFVSGLGWRPVALPAPEHAIP